MAGEARSLEVKVLLQKNFLNEMAADWKKQPLLVNTATDQVR